MNSDLSPRSRPHTQLRIVLTGAFALVALLLLFWGTSAANALPNKTPELVRMFTPAYGLVRLVIGLAAAAAVGALLALLGLGIYDVARNLTNWPSAVERGVRRALRR